MSGPQRPASPVASVAQVLKGDPLMVAQNQKRRRKRPQPWELSDPESDGAPGRKKRRVGEKQVRYAYAAHKHPAKSRADTAEAAVAWHESATEGRRPARQKQKWDPEQVRPSPLVLTDLEYVRELGMGGYGRVGVVRTRKRQYGHPLDVEHREIAIKALLKRKIREQEPLHASDFLDRSWDEKNVERGNLHWMGWHPFIAGMYDCLTDSRNLYLLQELGPLGSLDAYIDSHGPLAAPVAQFYFSNIVVALEHLASLHLVHGDIKPGNIVLGGTGYLMLADFGLASRWDEPRDWEHVGTPNYMSPEIGRGCFRPHALQALDWWSAACVLYEMATGRMVFDVPAHDPERFPDDAAVFEDVGRRVLAAHYYWPNADTVDPRLKRFVDEMLTWHFDQRLGTSCVKLEKTGKVVNLEIRRHAWFEGFPWEDIENRTYAAPYVPLEPPRNTEKWHDRQIPAQCKIPGIPRLMPPPHLAHDTRRRRWERHGYDEEAHREKARARADEQADIALDAINGRIEELKRRAEAKKDKGKGRATDGYQQPRPNAAASQQSQQQEGAFPAEASTRDKGKGRATDAAMLQNDEQHKGNTDIQQPQPQKTHERDENELGIVPSSFMPPVLKGGTLPLFRPLTLKPKFKPPPALRQVPLSPLPAPPPGMQQVPPPPLSSPPPSFPQDIPPRQEIPEALLDKSANIDDLLNWGRTNGWTMQGLVERSTGRRCIDASMPPPPPRPTSEDAFAWEKSKLDLRVRIAATAQQTGGPSYAKRVQACPDPHPTAGPSTIRQPSPAECEKARARQPIRTPRIAATGLSNTPGAQLARQPEPSASDSARTQAPAVSRRIAGQSESVIVSRPLLAESEARRDPQHQKPQEPREQRPTTANFPSQSQLLLHRTGADGGAKPQQSGARHQPYPAQPRKGMPRQVLGLGAVPAARPSRERGPNGRGAAECKRRGDTSHNALSLDRAGQANDSRRKAAQGGQQSQDSEGVWPDQARANDTLHNVLGLEWGTPSGSATRSLLGPLPRTPQGQIVPLGWKPKESPVPEDNARAPSSRLQCPTPAERRLEGIWPKRSPEPTSARAGSSARTDAAKAISQGIRLRSPTSTGPRSRASSSSVRKAAKVSDERHISFDDDRLPLSPSSLPMNAADLRERTPTRSLAPCIPASHTGSTTSPLFNRSHPLSPAGTMVGSPWYGSPPPSPPLRWNV